MSGIEIFGIVAAALQLADLGSRLSVKLYTHGQKARNTSLAAEALSRDVTLTCNVMRQLGESLREDNDARLCSAEAFETAQEVLNECQGVFKNIDKAIAPDSRAPRSSSLLLRMTQRVAEAQRGSQLAVLGSNLERLKSTMLLMLNVIMYAAQVRGKKEHRALVEQRQLIDTLLKEKAASENRYKLLSQATEQVDELQSYYLLMKTLLREIDAMQNCLQRACHMRIRNGVEEIHLVETTHLQQTHGDRIMAYFSDPLFSLQTAKGQAASVTSPITRSLRSFTPRSGSPASPPRRPLTSSSTCSLPLAPPPSLSAGQLEGGSVVVFRLLPSLPLLVLTPAGLSCPDPSADKFRLYARTSSPIPQDVDSAQKTQTAKNPVNWPLEEVIKWLSVRGFSQEWQDTFRSLDLHGFVFVSIGVSTQSGGVLQTTVYPELERQYGYSGVAFDIAHERKEGTRLRRLVRMLPLSCEADLISTLLETTDGVEHSRGGESEFAKTIFPARDRSSHKFGLGDPAAQYLTAADDPDASKLVKVEDSLPRDPLPNTRSVVSSFTQIPSGRNANVPNDGDSPRLRRAEVPIRRSSEPVSEQESQTSVPARKKFLMATADGESYQLLDISHVRSAENLRRLVSQRFSIPQSSCAIFATEYGQTEHDEPLNNLRLSYIWRHRADAVGSVKIFVGGTGVSEARRLGTDRDSEEDERPLGMHRVVISRSRSKDEHGSNHASAGTSAHVDELSEYLQRWTILDVAELSV